MIPSTVFHPAFCPWTTRPWEHSSERIHHACQVVLPRPSLPAPQSNDKIGSMLRDGGYGMIDVTQEARRATGEPKSRAPMRGIARGSTEGPKTPPLSPVTRMTRHRCPTDWSRGRPGWVGSRRLPWPERLDSTRAGQTWTCSTPRNAGQCAGINCYIGPT